MVRHRLCACALAALLLLASTLQAETLTLTAVDLGYYEQMSSDSGYSDPLTVNYLAGRYTFGTTGEYRNFFVFNLGTVTDQIVSAKLVLNTLGIQAANEYETFQLYDATTPIATLTAGGYNQSDTFSDLGSGVAYGSRNYYPSESDSDGTNNTRAEIILNADFVAAANTARGGEVALGGAVTSLLPASTADQYLFGYADATPLTDAQLVIETVPVPEPSMLFLSAAGCVGLLAFAWRKRR